MTQTTEIVRASQMTSVINRIIEIRYATELAQYEKDLAAYERALKRGKKELKYTQRHYFTEPTITYGYQVVKTVDGVKSIVDVMRPVKPNPHAWSYSGYDRSGGYTSHAGQSGMLANPEVNRDILPKRVEGYQAQMKAGLWRDLLSDPITVTAEGHVVNGQHRLAAASQVDWEKVDNDPAFLVVWGVDPAEAILADSSKRTARDQATIGARVLAAVND